jgi:3-dehydroquinate synthase
VRVGRGALDELAAFVAGRCGEGVVVVVSDSRVAPLHAPRVLGSLERLGVSAHLWTFPEGEASKTRHTKDALEDRLADLGVGRDGWIVALGGGVVGDLAGFAAATWNRGIAVVQAPTSLLAMVDAAIGGKTAVDVPAGKNLVGAFHPPRGVFADLDTLATLPDDAFRHGLAEVVKTAAIADRSLFRLVERDREGILGRDRAVLERVVLACARRKARIVARDERDAGVRVALNFGHTVGHALERVTEFGMPHGEAVAIGMAIELRLAERRLGFPAAHRRRTLDLLRSFGLPVTPPGDVPVDEVIAAVGLDKKNVGGQLRCAVPCALGRVPDAEALPLPVDRDALRAAWNDAVVGD